MKLQSPTNEELSLPEKLAVGITPFGLLILLRPEDGVSVLREHMLWLIPLSMAVAPGILAFRSNDIASFIVPAARLSGQ